MSVFPQLTKHASKAPLLCSALTITALTSPAVAADTQDDFAKLDEVVVSSRRFEERLQDTPLAVSAFQSSDIENLSIRNIADTASFTPNFIANAGPTGGNDGFYFIRGIGQTDPNPATDPGVATYIDGVYLGRVMGASMDAMDIARVEVLRGPQGTLFGRNTVGGAINITSRDPAPDFGAEIGASAGSRNLKQIRLSVDLPVSPAAALVVSANLRDQDGWGRRSDGIIFDSNKNQTLRAKLRLDPQDNFSAVLTTDYSKLTGTPQHSILIGVDPRIATNFSATCTRPNSTLQQFLASASCSPLGVPLPPGLTAFANPANPYVNTSSAAPVKDYKIYGTALTLAWNLGAIDVKSITSYRELSQDISIDYDSTAYRFYDGRFKTKQHQWSQEFQLSGTTDVGRWLLGAFRYNETNYHTNIVSLGSNNGCLPFPQPIIDAIAGSVGFTPGTYFYRACLGASFGPPSAALINSYSTPGTTRMLTNNQAFELQTKADAIFGQATINVAEHLSATLGLRWTKETKEQAYDFFVDNSAGVANLAFIPPSVVPTLSERNRGSGPNALPASVPTAYSKSWSEITPKAGLEWKPYQNQLYYLSYAKGFKSGGFNGRPNPNTFTGRFSAVTPYDPEKIDSYEVGAKTQWLDDHVRINVAAFHENYRGIQLFVLDQTTGFLNTLNASSRIRGAELEVLARPLAPLQIQAGLGFTNDNYTSIDPVVQAAGIRYGMHLPLTPRINGSAGVQYTWSLPHGRFALRGDYIFRSEYWFKPANTSLSRQGGFGLANARATYEFGDGQWTVAAYGLNIANKRYLTNVQDVISGGLGVAFGAVSAPREWGIEVRARLGSRR